MSYVNNGRVGRVAGPLPITQTERPPALLHFAIPQWFKLIGPGLVISIGYIDPGNWATDLAAGAYGYRLLWVLIVASALALLLQCAVAHLALASGEDLATMIAQRWRTAAPVLGVAFAAAIVATDFAEFAGIAVGLQLIFGLPLAAAAFIGLLGVTLVFLLGSGSLRKLQRTLIGLLWFVAAILVSQLYGLHPSIQQIASGAVVPLLPGHGAMLVAVGLIGATVMPHNLFLHSSLIVGDCRNLSENGRRERGRFYAGETFWALLIATLMNGAIVVVAVANKAAGNSLGEAFLQIRLHAGSSSALMFGGALAVSGLAASVTATWSADYVVSAFSTIWISPLLRRAAAAIPACALLAWGIDPLKLIIGSQIALALVLPVVIVPLVLLMMSRRFGVSRFSRPWLIASGFAAALCVSFDLALLGFFLRP